MNVTYLDDIQNIVYFATFLRQQHVHPHISSRSAVYLLRRCAGPLAGAGEVQTKQKARKRRNNVVPKA